MFYEKEKRCFQKYVYLKEVFVFLWNIWKSSWYLALIVLKTPSCEMILEPLPKHCEGQGQRMHANKHFTALYMNVLL